MATGHEEEDVGAGAGDGGILLSPPAGDPFVQGLQWPGAGLGLRTLTTALARVMDVLPAELVLCSPAGFILHANDRARKRLDADEPWTNVREEIRYLCVALHLQIAEQAGREVALVPQADRRVTLDGIEVHLRAVDLGVPRDAGSPVTLVLLDARESLSDQDLERAGLTRAEIRIARLVMRGRTNREIAHALSVSVHTVRHHVQHIHNKVGVRSRDHLTETLHRNRDRIASPKPRSRDGAHPRE